MTQNEVTASLPLLSGTLFSFPLSWLRSGSGVVNEQCLTVCFIGAVYRERLPLAAGSWHTLHLRAAKAEWNHTQGDRTERTSSTRLVITFKWERKRRSAYKIFHLIRGKSREVCTVGDEFQSWLSLNRNENLERNKGHWWDGYLCACASAHPWWHVCRFSICKICSAYGFITNRAQRIEK